MTNRPELAVNCLCHGTTWGAVALHYANFGYIHVLGDGNVSAMVNKVKDDSTGSDKAPVWINQNEDVNEAINTFKSMNKGKGYSLYELSRWERYCNGGKGMDEHDWRFVEAEGATNIPKDVVTGCIPPTHTYQGYLNAGRIFAPASL